MITTFLSPDNVFNLVWTLLSAGAVYGGIRADIKSMHERINAAQAAAASAHARIDTHLEKSL